MPELPEVETIRRQLEKDIVGRKILDAEVFYPKAVLPLKPSEFVKEVKSAKFVGIGRRAKILLLHLSNNNTVGVHLKLSGRLLLKEKGAKAGHLTEIIFKLGDKSLFYDDLRRFGWLKIIKTDQLENFFIESEFGPEPLEPDFTLEKFEEILKKFPRAKIKPLLMEQKAVAGVGNIYSQEACFCARILPTRHAASLSGKESAALYDCLRDILKSAINSGGSSVDDYVDLRGREGGFAPKLKVYSRGKEKCLLCGAVLKGAKLAGRGTVWCPKCQK